MMQHEADPARRKQGAVVRIEIMGDENADGTFGHVEGRKHRPVAAADRIDGVDRGVGRKRCRGKRSRRGIGAVPSLISVMPMAG